MSKEKFQVSVSKDCSSKARSFSFLRAAPFGVQGLRACADLQGTG